VIEHDLRLDVIPGSKDAVESGRKNQKRPGFVNLRASPIKSGGIIPTKSITSNQFQYIQSIGSLLDDEDFFRREPTFET